MRLIFCCLIFFFFGCVVKQSKRQHVNMDEQIPVIRCYADIKKHEGRRVKAIGKYEELNVGQHPKAKIFVGRAKIALSDGHHLILETHDKGIRTEKEIAKYRGKMVSVIGVVNIDCLAWGDGRQASITGPCFTMIEEIE